MRVGSVGSSLVTLATRPVARVVFGFGTKSGPYQDSQVTAFGSGHYANYVLDG